MPYMQVLNSCRGLSVSDRAELAREFDNIRTELDDIRAAFMSLRALLVAATAVGAGYNTTPTNLGTTTALTAAASPRFTRT